MMSVIPAPNSEGTLDIALTGKSRLSLDRANKSAHSILGYSANRSVQSILRYSANRSAPYILDYSSSVYLWI